MINIEQELKKFYLSYLKKTKKDPIYKKLRRNYRIQEPFVDYNKVIFDVCISTNMGMNLDDGSQATFKMFRPSFEAAHIRNMLTLQEPAVYCLHSKLMEAMELTDLPNAFPDLQQSVPFGILLLPEEKIELGEQDGVKYLIFSHFSMLDKLPKREKMKYNVLLEQENWRSVKWFAATSSSYTSYSEEIMIRDDGVILSRSDNQFISSLTSILVQSLYFVQEQKMVSVQQFGGNSKKRGSLTKQPKNQVVRYPQHLGKNFILRSRSRSEKISYPSFKSSPTPHIRRGHRKIVWHGEGRKLQKTVWIAPTWVGGETQGGN